MEVSIQLHVPAVIFSGEQQLVLTVQEAEWVREQLHYTGKNIFHTCKESNTDSSSVQSMAKSLHQPRPQVIIQIKT